MSPGQTGHITGQMGRVPGTDGTHTRGCPAKILYVYWFFLSQFKSQRWVIRHRPPGPHPRIRLALPSSGVVLASIQKSNQVAPQDVGIIHDMSSFNDSGNELMVI